MKRTALCVALLVAMISASALAQSEVTLKFKSEKGKIMKYNVLAGGSVSADMDQLPFPGSTLTAKNVKADISIDTFFKTNDATEDQILFNVRTKTDKVILGNLIKLGDLGDLTSAMNLDMTMSLGPNGKIASVEMNTPGLTALAGAAKGKGGGIPGMEGMGLDMVMPMLVSLLPPMFPDTPLKVGDKWTQEMNTKDFPLPILPKVAFDFTLDKVEGDVATISFVSTGKFDGAFLNNFLAMIPEIPLGEDSLKIQKINFVATWDTKGNMLFNVAEGRIENVTGHSDVVVDADGSVGFVHPDKTKETWTPKMNMQIGLDGKMAYQGTMTADEYDKLFPAPVEEKPAPAPKKPAPKKKPAAKPKTKKT